MRRRDLAALAARPGIDPRVNCVLAEVVDVGVDPAHGVFADITFLPIQQEETAHVGTCYAGNGFGWWFPVEAGDTVLVALPLGDAGWGPVIVARMWSSTDVPPTELQGAADPHGGSPSPILDVYLRVKPGQGFKIRTSAAGGVDVAVEGTGDAVLTAGGRVRLQDGSQPFVRGTAYTNAMTTLLAALNTLELAVGTFATSLGAGAPAAPVLHGEVVPNAAALALAIAAFTAQIGTFNLAQAAALSTKVYGQ